MLVVGMKRVVGDCRYVEDVVDVWMPRPRRTVRDSSVAMVRTTQRVIAKNGGNYRYNLYAAPET
jgi:hypothetical protein